MHGIPTSHPRYRSLLLRAYMADEMERGLIVPEGLIAHGRGEAFDYIIGEKTLPFAAKAEKAAAARLLLAKCPVISVNGNVAALASKEVAALAQTLPSLKVEVNLFHRTPARAELVAARLRSAGIAEVLGVHPTVRLRGLPSDRGWVDQNGILIADTVLVPLEDGDRAKALASSGKFVIAIDLNPLSRTARAADLPIIDELKRALVRINSELKSLRRKRSTWADIAEGTDGEEVRLQALAYMAGRLKRLAKGSSQEPPGPVP
jgi:4-phosphopantoate--beta-alanine ligase